MDYDLALLSNEGAIHAQASVSVEHLGSDRSCCVRVSWGGNSVESSAYSVYHALQSVREQLEPLGLVPDCYGSAPDVQTSGMAGSMGDGTFAYRLSAPKRKGRTPLVNIFHTEPGLRLGCVEEQRGWLYRQGRGLFARIVRQPRPTPANRSEATARDRLIWFFEIRDAVLPKSDGDLWVQGVCERFLRGAAPPATVLSQTLTVALHRARAYPEALPPGLPKACELMLGVLRDERLTMQEPIGQAQKRLELVREALEEMGRGMADPTYGLAHGPREMERRFRPASPEHPDYHVWLETRMSQLVRGYSP